MLKSSSLCLYSSNLGTIRKKGGWNLKKSSPLKLLSQTQPNFAEMILRWSPFKIVSVSAVLYPRWPPLLKIEISSNGQNCSQQSLVEIGSVVTTLISGAWSILLSSLSAQKSFQIQQHIQHNATKLPNPAARPMITSRGRPLSDSYKNGATCSLDRAYSQL
jgi:hypothetical protein